MSQQISLKEAERKAFSATVNDGLWDIFLGCFFLMFPVALYLSYSLGDFWSSVALIPFWALAYLAIWLVRKYVVIPRVGVVKFGQARKTKLKTLSFVLLAVNIIALILGLIAALSFGKVPGQIYSIVFGLILLTFFSLAGYFLNFPRLYIYGLLLGFSPLIGEWLWSQGYAAHHGIPVVFGVTSCIMILIGLVVFVRLLHDNPIPKEEIPSKDA